MNTRQLFDEIEARRKEKTKIRNLVNDFCFSEYGIENFFAIADKYFSGRNFFTLCLARQVPCQNIEHFAINLLADFLSINGLNTRAMSMAFTRDSYVSSNEYKASLIKIPYLFRSQKNKRLFINKEHILAGHQRVDIDGKVLDILETCDGMKLVDFHYAMRRKSFGENDHLVDCSSLLRELASQSVISRSRNMPKHVFVRSGLKDRKVNSWEADFSSDLQDPRPQADWYYFLYLLLFLDGSHALASTVDEDPKVIAWFSTNIKKIKEICGFEPLLIDTPLRVQVEDFSSKLNEFPNWAIEDRNWARRISLSGKNTSNALYDVTEHIAQQLISLA